MTEARIEVSDGLFFQGHSIWNIFIIYRTLLVYAQIINIYYQWSTYTAVALDVQCVLVSLVD